MGHRFTTGMLLLVATTTIRGYEADWLSGSALIDGRIRYEAAEQDGIEGSDALTYRLRLGYQTELSETLSFLMEGEGNLDLHMGTYDAYSGAQGEPGHTVIADPQNLELNRLQLTMDLTSLSMVLGRQRIIRNNARFIGNVGWRQNEQTYDALGISLNASETFDVYYAYLDRAIRIFGRRANVAAQREFEMESHILEVQTAIGDAVDSGAYAYLLGIENAAANSSDTIGVWAKGKSTWGANETAFDWRIEYAMQTDNSHSPASADFDLGYYHLSIGTSLEGMGFVLGYEVLEGDGTRGFSTPLATLHAYNGFADRFLSTPADGIEDAYVKFTSKFSDTMTAALIFHNFEQERSSTSLGSEIDGVFGWKINANMSLTAKLAMFDGSGSIKDVEKYWIQMDMKY